MSAFASGLRNLTQKEPIIVWSCVLGGIGTAAARAAHRGDGNARGERPRSRPPCCAPPGLRGGGASESEGDTRSKSSPRAPRALTVGIAEKTPAGLALPLISYQVRESWGVKTEPMPKASQVRDGPASAAAGRARRAR